MKKRIWVLLMFVLTVVGAHAQAHAQAPTQKIAISSLVGDAITVTMYRERVGTNLSNTSSVIKMPGPLLDMTLMKVAQDAITKARPGAAVFTLKVPAAGSNTDPALVVADGKVVADNVLVQALRQQGFTHLLIATKHRNNNIVRLRDGAIGTGQGMIEGLGFYVDPTIGVRNTQSGEVAEGIIAPYLYVQLRLVDLDALQVQSVQTITANSAVSSAENKNGVDAWGALTPAEKMQALQALIDEHVAAAVPLLFQPK
jgi:hypothetical protein